LPNNSSFDVSSLLELVHTAIDNLSLLSRRRIATVYRQQLMVSAFLYEKLGRSMGSSPMTTEGALRDQPVYNDRPMRGLFQLKKCLAC
jgi:hypothetical protein